MNLWPGREEECPEGAGGLGGLESVAAGPGIPFQTVVPHVVCSVFLHLWSRGAGAHRRGIPMSGEGLGSLVARAQEPPPCACAREGHVEPSTLHLSCGKMVTSFWFQLLSGASVAVASPGRGSPSSRGCANRAREHLCECPLQVGVAVITGCGDRAHEEGKKGVAP